MRWMLAWAAAALVLECLSAFAAEPPRNLLAHGTGRSGSQSPIWLAVVESKGSQDSTVVYFRNEFGAKEWIALQPIPARVLAVTGYSGELVVVLKSPSDPPWPWQWAVFSTRYSYGPALPSTGSSRTEILAMAGDARSLWALGREPSRAPAATSSQPSTRPAHPALYRLSGGSWKAQPAEWPGDLEITPQDPLSMAVIGKNEEGRPTLAVSTGREIHLLQWADDKWARIDSLASQNTRFKLLNLDGRVALWLPPEKAEEGAGRIWARGKLIPLLLAGPVPVSREMDLTVASDQIRLFFRRDGKLMEQLYAFDGTASGQPTELKWTKARVGDDQLQNWITIAVMAVLTILILNILLRRRAASREDDQGDQDE